MNDLYLKDLNVKSDLRLRAKGKSIQLDERIDRKIRNAAISSTSSQRTVIQLTAEKETKKAISDLDDIQILSEMEEQTCSYADISK